MLEFTGEDDSKDRYHIICIPCMHAHTNAYKYKCEVILMCLLIYLLLLCSYLVGMFDGYDENGHMRLVNGDPSPRCALTRSGTVVVACGKEPSVFVYAHSCEYQFTVLDPGVCLNYNSPSTSMLFAPDHPQPHHDTAHNSIMHYEKFGTHLKSKTVESTVHEKDLNRKFKLQFYDKLSYTDMKTDQFVKIGYFNGIESFRRDAIRLSNGDFCAEIGAPNSGILIMKCGHKQSLNVEEAYPCVFHATFYDDDPSCSELKDNIW